MSLLRLRSNKAVRWTLGTAVLGAGVYMLDARSEAQLLQRNFRVFYNGVALAVDYKLNFRPTKDEAGARRIEKLHERVANRMFDVFERNGGLYIKIGQIIGTQSTVLPKPYQKRAQRLFDSAPALPFKVVERVFMEDFDGLHPSQVFKEFDLMPIASASIAQVHKARLHTGEVVAVKIQKPAILKQMNWDLLAYRLWIKVYEYLFDLPLSWSTDYVEEHFRMEADFTREARNGQEAWQHIQNEPSLRDRVYIPKVYNEFSSKRVLVCEWVNGVKLTDVENLKARNLNLEKAMQTTVEAFSSQIFKSGLVHGDPHPGNVLVREHPTKKNDVQVVLIDHGLYIRESEKFRKEYCQLWEAMFLLDLKTMNEICKGWGIQDSNMFASVTLQKPFSPKKAVHIGSANLNMEDIYELQTTLKDRFRDFLKDQALFPRELIFISRNMSIVRANNRSLGSPVNRINIMARWAVYGLSDQGSGHSNQVTMLPLGKQIQHYLCHVWRTIRFECTLFTMSASFWIVRLRERIRALLFKKQSKGFEELMDEKLKSQLKEQFGIELDESVFDA